jgi:hypothetical protein
MSDDHGTTTYSILYRFELQGGGTRDFEILLDEQTLELVLPEEPAKPEWTRLHYQQCEHCPLGNSTEYCPVAVNLGSLVSQFENAVSYDKAKVTVITKERVFQKETTVQKGLSALIGIYMVTSNCPIMDKLRPMVRFHLPFATITETAYRAITMYLMAQFFRVRRGEEPDWELRKLADIYKAVSLVNKGIAQRVSVASSRDAGVNAVVILNSLGDSVPYAIENGLSELEMLFRPYLEGLEGSARP